MSLRKKSTMTLEKLSANQANGKRSRGIVTAAGRENILTRQVEICAGQGQALLKESLAGALRKGGGNRPRPPQYGADAEDGRVQFSANLADHQSAFEDQKPGARGGFAG